MTPAEMTRYICLIGVFAYTVTAIGYGLRLLATTVNARHITSRRRYALVTVAAVNMIAAFAAGSLGPNRLHIDPAWWNMPMHAGGDVVLAVVLPVLYLLVVAATTVSVGVLALAVVFGIRTSCKTDDVPWRLPTAP